MKILYFSQFFPPERTAGAFRTGENSKIWSGKGHKITVFTGLPNYPTGKVFEGYKTKLLQEFDDDGVRVLRSKLLAKPNNNIVNRFLNYFSFTFYSIINILFQTSRIGKDYDIVLATSGPIFVGFVGWLFSKIHRKKFVLEIRDITFKQILATGTGEQTLLYRIIRRSELFLCRSAHKVIVVTNGFKKVLIENGVTENKISVITNGMVVKDLENTEQSEKKDKFIISYFGTLGISQDIKNIFRYLKHINVSDQTTQCMIIGDGAQKNELMEYIDNQGLNDLILLPGISQEELERFYGLSDLCMVVLRDSSDFQHTIPSKVFQIMGRGRPILYIGPDGEAAEIIRRAGAGIILANNYECNIETLNEFFSQKDATGRLRQMGINGYGFAKENYDRNRLAEEYINILDH
jgi:colanic acid biosynthesis glycosyl transferase WcaI